MKRCIEDEFGFGILPAWSVHPGDTRVTSMELDGLASVQVYFGMASFMQDNPAVMHLYHSCQTEFMKAIKPPL